MKITRRDFEWAVDRGLIDAGTADKLWKALAAHVEQRPRFDLTHVAYYAGALVVILAMTWFMTQAWQRYGGLGLLILAAAYGGAFGLAGATMWKRPGMRIPGGLLVTVAVCMAPLAVFGVESMLGMWPDAETITNYVDFHFRIDRNYVLMEIGVIVTALIALRFCRFPFLVMPIAVALWYMAMDLPPLIFGKGAYEWLDAEWVSLWFGLGMLLVAYLVDRRTREDFAFWLYLFGGLTFWGGLSWLLAWDIDQFLGMSIYCLICVGMMLVSVLLQRRALMVFGALGVVNYLAFLSWVVFRDSLVFPFLLTVIGLAIIWTGMEYRKHQERIESSLLERLPEGVSRWLPASRDLPAERFRQPRD